MMIGSHIHATIYNFNHPVKKSKHKETIYFHFNAKIISKDNKPIQPGNHLLQLPAKTVVCQLHDMLKAKGMLEDKEVTVTISKKNTYHSNITIH